MLDGIIVDAARFLLYFNTMSKVLLLVFWKLASFYYDYLAERDNQNSKRSKKSKCYKQGRKCMYSFKPCQFCNLSVDFIINDLAISRHY